MVSPLSQRYRRWMNVNAKLFFGFILFFLDNVVEQRQEVNGERAMSDVMLGEAVFQTQKYSGTSAK